MTEHESLASRIGYAIGVTLCVAIAVFVLVLIVAACASLLRTVTP